MYRTLAAQLLLVGMGAALLAGCGDDAIAFASPSSGLIRLEVVAPDATGVPQGDAIDEGLVTTLASIEGVVDIVGTQAMYGISIRDESGNVLEASRSILGETWVPGAYRQYFHAEITAGAAPTSDSFAVSEQTAEKMGLEIGSSYKLFAFGQPVPATLSGVFEIGIDEPLEFPLLADTVIARDVFTDTGRYRSAAILIDADNAPTETIAAVRQMLPDDFVLSGFPFDTIDTPLVKKLCDYLDGGDNDLADVVEMSQDGDSNDGYRAALAAARALPTECPQWSVDDDAYLQLLEQAFSG